MPWILDPPISSDAEWYYADTQAVEDLIGDGNTQQVFDLDDDGNIDADSVIRAGLFTDGYIDLKLRNASLTAPNDLTDTAITAALKSASAHLAVWYGFHQRGARETQPGVPSNMGISGLMNGYKKIADDLIDMVITVLASEDADDSTGPAGSFSFVPIIRDNELI